MINSLEDFDWDKIDAKGFGSGYSTAEKAQLEELYGDTLTQITEKEVVKGVVVGIVERDVIVNIGFKSDGLVPLSEFRDMPDLKIGDEIDVYIENQEDPNGQLVLSRRKAKILTAWDNIQKALDTDIIVEGIVKRRTKGGLIVDIYGVEAFLPGSQIDVKPIRDFDIYVGKKMEVKVIKINYTNDNVVVSHKVLIEKDLEAQKALILNNLEKGQVLEGVIKNMTNFGVFIDLGGVDGLLHITDISWGRVNHPDEVLKLDQKVNIVVLDFDDDKRRISLGMKQLSAHPWESLAEEIQVGSKVKGKIVNVADYGAFLEVVPGVEGLIHVSEMSWSSHLRSAQDFLKVGEEVECVVLNVDKDERKLSLGMKQLMQDPWEGIEARFPVESKHKAKVRAFTNFGVFCELADGIDGLIHISDLSWSKKIKHPSEFCQIGDEIDVVVLELDKDNRRISLGHKQLEENPWDVFETVFVEGSSHQGTIVKKEGSHAIVTLPYGLEGFCMNKNLKKADGSTAKVEETLDFIVLEFNKNQRKISVSHTGTWKEEEAGAEAPKKAARPKKEGGAESSSAVKAVNAQVEKSTLGDLDVLANLKDKMEGNNSETAE